MSFADLNRRAKLYVVSVTACGIAAIVHAIVTVASDLSVDYRWLILAGLTLLTGSLNVKLASVSATISVSETFVFTSVILFGTGPGTLTVALDAFVVSIWVAYKNRELYRLFFNVAAPAVSIWIAAKAFFLLLGQPPLARLPQANVGVFELALPLLAFTLTYFLLNSWLIAIAIALKDRVSAAAVWRDNLVWLSLNYFGGASVAALLVGSRNLDVAVLLVIAPILLVLYFTFKTAMGRVEDANRHLAEVNRLYFSTIETLAMAIDAKDQVTHGHLRRVQDLALGLAKAVGVSSAEQLKAIEAAALLHDLGKLAIPEHILNKPGPLNQSELALMQRHSSIGAEILSAIKFPYPVVPVVRHHHENWDGSGYPDGLMGTEIPVAARILAVVDCFDALTSDRPYRPKLSDAEAIRILRKRRGTMYDPMVVDSFEDVLSTLRPHEQTESIRSDSRARTSQLSDLPPLRHVPPGLLYRVDKILQAVLDATKATLAMVFLTDVDGMRLVPLSTVGQKGINPVTPEMDVGERLSGWVAANGRPILNSDPGLDLGSEQAARYSLLKVVSLPIRHEDQTTLAVLTVYSDCPEGFSPEDVAVLAQSAWNLGTLLRDLSLPNGSQNSLWTVGL